MSGETARNSRLASTSQECMRWSGVPDMMFVIHCTILNIDFGQIPSKLTTFMMYNMAALRTEERSSPEVFF